jgi:hypothetical protein
MPSPVWRRTWNEHVLRLNRSRKRYRGIWHCVSAQLQTHEFAPVIALLGGVGENTGVSHESAW